MKDETHSALRIMPAAVTPIVHVKFCLSEGGLVLLLLAPPIETDRGASTACVHVPAAPSLSSEYQKKEGEKVRKMAKKYGVGCLS